MGGKVSDAIQHLRQPDRVFRSTFRGLGVNADEVYYYCNSDCLYFVWLDAGIEPRIERGLRGIGVTCDRWTTSSGLHVGSSMKEVTARISQYCPVPTSNGLLIQSKEGIYFESKDRNSPVSRILLMPANAPWNCSE
jgi:hypothetical protein